VIGIQYGISGLIFLFFGFSLMMMMRWQLAYPGQALPVIGNAAGPCLARARCRTAK
jgi:cytochrome c oxidase subunit 1